MSKLGYNKTISTYFRLLYLSGRNYCVEIPGHLLLRFWDVNVVLALVVVLVFILVLALVLVLVLVLVIVPVRPDALLFLH